MYIYNTSVYVNFFYNKQQYGNSKTIQGDVQLWASIFLFKYTCLHILFCISIHILNSYKCTNHNLYSYMRTNTELLLTIT